MPYPAQISLFELSAPDVGKPVIRSGNVRYKMVEETHSSVNVLTMHKSTDAGLTWAEVDSGGRPVFLGTDSVVFEYDDGVDLWYTASDASTTSVHRFMTASDEWATPLSVTAAQKRTSPSYLFSRKQGICVKRPSGDLVYVYLYTYTSSMATQVAGLKFQISTNGGATWSSSATLLAEGSFPDKDDSIQVSYYLTGACVASDGRVVVSAARAAGSENNATECHVSILPDDTVADFELFEWDARSMLNSGPRSGITFGKTMLVSHCEDGYAAIPMAFEMPSSGSDAFHQPAVSLVPASGSERPASMHRQREKFTITFGNHRSVSITGDDTHLILVWAESNDDADGTVRCSTWAGRYWSMPQTLFTTTYSNEGFPESLEATYSDGRLAVAFSGPGTGALSYSALWWESDFTPSATACTGGSGNINSLRSS